MQPTDIDALRRIALEGLRIDPDEPDHRLVWEGDDALWQNPDCSLIFPASEYADDTAFRLLTAIRDWGDLGHAIGVIIAAEVDYAKAIFAHGSTRTRVLETYDDGEVSVQISLTTTREGPSHAN